MTREPTGSMDSDDAQDQLSLATDVVSLLKSRHETLATAESLTGGLVAAALTDVAGSSAVIRGGIVAYAIEVKRDVLAVDAAVLSQHGAVSAEMAVEMAARAVELFTSTWSVSTTGVAGPDRQDGQPVGTVHVAVARSDPARRGAADEATGATCVSRSVGVKTTRLALTGSRRDIRVATVRAALRALRECLADP